MWNMIKKLMNPSNIFYFIKKMQTFLGAVIGLAAISLGNYQSNELVRRQNSYHLQMQCDSLRNMLHAEIYIINNSLYSAYTALDNGKRTNSGVVFPLPDASKYINYKENIYLLNNKSQESVIKFMIDFDILFSDLSNTNSNYHSGDTFGVSLPQNIEMYKNIVSAIIKEGVDSINYLKDKDQCLVWSNQ